MRLFLIQCGRKQDKAEGGAQLFFVVCFVFYFKDNALTRLHMYICEYVSGS